MSKTQNEINVQDLIGVAGIENGLVYMKDGSIVKILEILPLNYEELTNAEKDQAAFSFAFGIKGGPKRVHIKVIRSAFDLQPFIENIEMSLNGERDPKVVARAADYINNTMAMQSDLSRRNRYFYIFEYEGEDGKRSTSVSDIYYSMVQQTLSVTGALQSAGNIVLDHAGKGNIEALKEILYECFNPGSRAAETYSIRKKKIDEGIKYIHWHEGSNHVPPVDDYIAPRGIKFCKWDYMATDGLFQTFLTLRGNAYPQKCIPGEVIQTITSSLIDYDLDIYIELQHRERSIYTLDRMNVVQESIAMSGKLSRDKSESLQSGASNAKYIKSCMVDGDEDLYKVCTILTLRAQTQKQLKLMTGSYKKRMQAKSYYFEDSYMQCPQYYQMTQPFMKMNDFIFNSNARNMTNRSIPSLYCFTTLDMFSPKGACMGTTGNNTLFSLDTFDTSKFPNPHMFIMGTSGSGKSFTEMMLTSRMRIHGIRTMFILPLKGHEYKDMVESLGGSFIPLRPGSKTCLNIFEIRPEGKGFDTSHDADIEEDLNQASLLTKKIQSIKTWFSLLCGKMDRLTIEESSELVVLLMQIYEDYGITEDNRSIYEEGSNRLKPMPTIGDLYDRILTNPVLSRRSPILNAWVNGPSRNMDGQTNVDVSNKLVAFDVNEDIIGEELLPAYMYIAFDYCYSIAKENELEKCAIACDEIWKILALEGCAKEVFRMAKILRAYAASLICATQDIEDALHNEYGRAILTNSSIKIYLRMTQEELGIVQQSVTLSEQNKREIMNFPQGVGFVGYGSERIKVRFVASEEEVALYTTDINVKQTYAAKKKGL